MLCLAAYGLVIPWLGFYWDDFPIAWIAATMGGGGLARYFATNRPFWGLIYQITTPLLGSSPLVWQITALGLRFATGLSFWWLLRLIWPRQKRFAGWAAALFVVYPGFSEQFISFVFSHFFIVLNLFLLSLSFSLLSLRKPRWFWPLTLLAWLASAVNLLSMEYFFLLDLLRPVLIWLVLSEGERTDSLSARQRLAKTLVLWLPYLVLFAGVMIWRSLFFGFHTYQPTFMSQFRSQPLAALLALALSALRDIALTVFGAWGRAFHPPALPAAAQNQMMRYWLVAAAAMLLAGGYLILFQRKENSQGAQTRRWLWQPLLVGALALLVAGGPFWLTGLQVSLSFSGDRFSLPFMIGASLILAALLQAIPLPRWALALPLAVALGLAAGLQFQNAILYKLDWSVQTNLFQQMLWRMPDLEPGRRFYSTNYPCITIPITHWLPPSTGFMIPAATPHAWRTCSITPPCAKTVKPGWFRCKMGLPSSEITWQPLFTATPRKLSRCTSTRPAVCAY